MNISAHTVQIGIVIALVVGILYWIIAAASRSNAKREEERRARLQYQQQAWDQDTSRSRR